MEGIMIKDAAKMLEVEAHVLRYWEEELELEIKRNSMGHRYYDERDIKLFSDVKELKRRGLSLKDIKTGIDNKRKADMDMKKESIENVQEEDVLEAKSQEKMYDEFKKEFFSDKDEKDDREILQEIENDNIKIVDFKMAQMQTAMNKIVANALKENKDIITTSIRSQITEDVMRQFDTVMREKEEKEEARFKKLDEYLRSIQLANEEVAAAKSKKWFKKRKK